MRRVQHKVDANQGPIVAALEGIGVQVVDLAAMGEGVCDLLAAWRGCVYLIEIKNPQGRGNRLTIPQIRFHEKMRNASVKVHVVEDVAQALAVFGARLAA